MVFVIRKQEISTPIMKADGCSIVEAWTEKFVLDVFRDGFSICRGPLGSGLKKNWRVAALKYLRPVTYVPCSLARLKLAFRLAFKKILPCVISDVIRLHRRPKPLPTT